PVGACTARRGRGHRCTLCAGPCRGRRDHRRAGDTILWRSHLSRQGSRGAYLDLWRHGRGEDFGTVGRRGRLHHEDAARSLSAAIDRTLAALADPKRRRAVELLGQRPHSAGELARALGLAPPAMSRHLRALKEGGLIEGRFPSFDARVRIYSLKDGATDELKRWLSET